MTAAADLATRAAVEDFLYREAALLDNWDLDAWLGLYTDDARYEVPPNDKLDADPRRDLLLIDDDRLRMQARVERLNNRRAHREYPHSRTNHQVFNVRVHSEDGELVVAASFTVWRFRAGKSSTYVGKYRYRLRPAQDGFQIAYKRVELDMTDLRAVADVAIIL